MGRDLFDWTQRTMRMKGDALKTMHAFIERMAQHDATLAEQAAGYLIAFERRIPWAVAGENGYFAIESLPEEGSILGRFVVLPHERFRDMGHYAGWYPRLRDLVVFDFFDPRPSIASSILLHELFHVHDDRTALPGAGDPLPDGRYPIETDAWQFQSDCLNAYSQGQFHEEIQSLSDRLDREEVRYLVRGQTVIPALSPSFMRLFSERRPPDFCVNTLILQVQYELSRERIRRSELDVVRRLETAYTTFTACLSAPPSPKETTFIREFVDRW